MLPLPAPPKPPAGTPAVVLLSGGLDSATVLAQARADGLICHTVAFDYGQRHRHELDAAQRLAHALGAASHRIIGLDLRSIGGSALTADIDVPKSSAAAAKPPASPDIPITYVPARNIVFLALAAGLAEVLSAQDVFIGVNAVDYSGYPDCRPEFIEAFQHALTLGTRSGAGGRPIRIHAPLVHLSKADIIRRGTALGLDYRLTHSCYDPIPRAPATLPALPPLACGRCDSCRLRRQGFADAGIPDPTAYAPPT